jgi:hypothetical protein
MIDDLILATFTPPIGLGVGCQRLGEPTRALPGLTDPSVLGLRSFHALRP